MFLNPQRRGSKEEPQEAYVRQAQYMMEMQRRAALQREAGIKTISEMLGDQKWLKAGGIIIEGEVTKD